MYAPLETIVNGLPKGDVMSKSLGSASRRKFFQFAGVIGAGAVAGSRSLAAVEDKEENVSPAEDLMREHGVLDRVLLIYDEIIGRIESGKNADPAVLRDAAEIIRNFIQNYHEKLEENYLFPRFRNSGKLVDLVATLKEQHQRGRALTDAIEQQAILLNSKNAADRKKLELPLKAFIRMYRPHAAREDTVLFPALREIVSPREYADLGDKFEDEEHQLFGEHGFENMVQKVADIERRLGIENLAQFTPKA